jgi:hypothetical protein
MTGPPAYEGGPPTVATGDEGGNDAPVLGDEGFVTAEAVPTPPGPEGGPPTAATGDEGGGWGDDSGGTGDSEGGDMFGTPPVAMADEGPLPEVPMADMGSTPDDMPPPPEGADILDAAMDTNLMDGSVEAPEVMDGIEGDGAAVADSGTDDGTDDGLG